MRDKGLGIVVALTFIVFVMMYGLTGGFSSAAVSPGGVTVRTAGPTVDDDISRGFAPGYIWVDQTAPAVYVLIDGADGAADWNRVD